MIDLLSAFSLILLNFGHHYVLRSTPSMVAQETSGKLDQKLERIAY